MTDMRHRSNQDPQYLTPAQVMFMQDLADCGARLRGQHRETTATELYDLGLIRMRGATYVLTAKGREAQARILRRFR